MVNIVYDMHSHFYDFSDGEIEEILSRDKDLFVVSVSDDVESLERNMYLAELYGDRVIVCAGFHPWSIRDRPLIEAEEVARRASRLGVNCIGEVGLDKKFLKQYTWDIQVKIFSRFIDLARDLGAFINIHAPGAWREALTMIVEGGIEKAMIHWYTGPLDLIEVIGSLGYKISINPALRIQEKHLNVAKSTPLEYMVLESDGPYNYRGMRLNPLMVRDTINLIASIKGLSSDYVSRVITANSERLIYT